jgi:hypothetical protein
VFRFAKPRQDPTVIYTYTCAVSGFRVGII